MVAKTFVPFFAIFLVLILLAGASTNAVAQRDISGKFALIDHEGRAVNSKTYQGKVRLVFFGFTNCPDICPTTMAQVSKVMNMLGKQAEQVQPLFITIDHRNDTVDRVAAYVSAFHPGIAGLTGSEEQIRMAAAAFNVTYGSGSDVFPPSASEFYHSSYLYFMDRDGALVDLFGYGTKADVIAAEVRQFLES